MGEVDVQMARRAGCVGIGIPDEPAMRDKMRPYADAIVASLTDIKVLED